MLFKKLKNKFREQEGDEVVGIKVENLEKIKDSLREADYSVEWSFEVLVPALNNLVGRELMLISKEIEEIVGECVRLGKETCGFKIKLHQNGKGIELCGVRVYESQDNSKKSYKLTGDSVYIPIEDFVFNYPELLKVFQKLDEIVKLNRERVARVEERTFEEVVQPFLRSAFEKKTKDMLL